MIPFPLLSFSRKHACKNSDRIFKLDSKSINIRYINSINKTVSTYTICILSCSSGQSKILYESRTLNWIFVSYDIRTLDTEKVHEGRVFARVLDQFFSSQLLTIEFWPRCENLTGWKNQVKVVGENLVWILFRKMDQSPTSSQSAYYDSPEDQPSWVYDSESGISDELYTTRMINSRSPLLATPDRPVEKAENPIPDEPVSSPILGGDFWDT